MHSTNGGYIRFTALRGITDDMRPKFNASRMPPRKAVISRSAFSSDSARQIDSNHPIIRSPDHPISLCASASLRLQLIGAKTKKVTILVTFSKRLSVGGDQGRSE